MRNFELFQHVIINEKNESFLFRNQVELANKNLLKFCDNFEISDYDRMVKLIRQPDKLINRNVALCNIIDKSTGSKNGNEENNTNKYYSIDPQLALDRYYEESKINSDSN